MTEEIKVEEQLQEANSLVKDAHENLAAVEQLENHLALHGGDVEDIHIVARKRREIERTLERAYDVRQEWRIIDYILTGEDDE